MSMRVLAAALWISAATDVAGAALPAGAADCAAIDDDTARLACYDRHNPPHKINKYTTSAQPNAAVARAQALPTEHPQPTRAQSTQEHSTGTSDSSTARTVPADAEFGLSEQQRRKREPRPASQMLVAHVSSISMRADGQRLLRLDNGQSWLQLDRRGGADIRQGDRVSITQGMLGSYLLRSDSGVSARVQRLN
jgi:hypothetical protein